MKIEEENKLAESLGFEIEPDERRGAGWGKFHKGNMHVWSLGYGWQTAYVENGRFVKHRKYKELKSALMRYEFDIASEKAMNDFSETFKRLS